MITTSVKISSDGKETGALLAQYLQARGVFHRVGPATVCYGLSSATRPSLNAACQSTKVARMRRMQDAGVALVPWTDNPAIAAKMRFPLFARKSYGMGAKDLVPVFDADEIPWRVSAGFSWFSSVIPIESEMRCWVWRDEVLQAFEKQMQRPADYTALGRNVSQGFAFVSVQSRGPVPYNALLAVQALGLDFGAVDLIVGKDGGVYVLEVNTAPGAIRSGAQSTLGALADRIADWCSADCPDR